MLTIIDKTKIIIQLISTDISKYYYTILFFSNSKITKMFVGSSACVKSKICFQYGLKVLSVDWLAHYSIKTSS